MAAVLTRNPGTDSDIVDPVKDDGSRYRYEMIFAQGRSRAYADTTADLIDALVPGYGNLAEPDQTAARVRYATNLLAPVQATVLAAHDQNGLSDEEKASLFAPRFEAVVVEEWASEVPLVLLDVHYAPFSDIPAPVSALEQVESPRNLIWVRASTDEDLLMSLDLLGVISLGENDDYLV